MGMPAEEARYYQSELKAGQTIVAVNANGRSDKALDILRRHGGRPCESPAAIAALVEALPELLNSKVLDALPVPAEEAGDATRPAG